MSNENLTQMIKDAALIMKGGTMNVKTGYTGGAIIGLTDGGTSVSHKINTRNIKVDGHYMVAKGLITKESEEVIVTTNIKTMTPEVLKLAVNGVIAEKAEGDKYTVVTSKSDITADDYNDFYVIGEMINGKEVIIEVKNCICSSGAEIKTEDGKEVVMELTFTAAGIIDENGQCKKAEVNYYFAIDPAV